MQETLSNLDWKAMAVPTLFYILSFVLVTLLLPRANKLPELTRKLFDWIYSKAGTAKNTYLAGLLQRLSIIVRDVVIQVENTAIEDLKQKAKDGQLTKEELLEALKNIKLNAINQAKEHIKLQGLFELVTTVLFGNEEGLTKWLTDHLETQVATLPPSGLQTNGPALATKVIAKVEPAAKVEEPAAPVATPVPPPAAG